MAANDDGSTGQVNASAAEVYEDFFVPALFGQWPDIVLDAAQVTAGDDVLDVGCGTGVLARAARGRIAPGGSVTGVDPNPGMLAVAQRTGEIEWRHAGAERLPFADATFDAVVSQFALMFFSDKARAVAEMCRVSRPGARLAVATWADASESPGYAAMIALLRDLFGDEAATALEAPFSVGTADRLAEALEPAGPDISITRRDGLARFASIDAWMHTDIRGWTLADMIDDDQYSELLERGRRDLAAFVAPDGSVAFAAPALIASVRRATS